MTSKLLGLRVENYKRVELVEIAFDPAGGVVALMGENEAGKTSVIDALVSAIAGRKMPKVTKAVRGDADKATIIATFDDLVITRIFKANGTTQIILKTPEGRPVADPEETMRRLYSHVALDPLAFSRLNEADQIATLLGLIGFDPSQLDTEFDERFKQRTGEKARAKSLSNQLDAMPPARAGVPAEETPVAQLATELDRQTQHNQLIQTGTTAVAQRQRTLDDARTTLAAATLAVENAKNAFDTETIVLGRLGEITDLTPIREQLNSVDELNAAVRSRKATAKLAGELKDATVLVSSSDARLVAIKAEKQAALAAVQMPVPGLKINLETNTLELHGEAFADASTGVKIRTGSAIAMALNPDLALIIIRDASLLDQGNRAVIDELAKANEFTVLCEFADTNSPTGVVLVDGFVAEVRS